MYALYYCPDRCPTLPLLAVMVIVLLLITYVEPIAMGLVWLLGAK